MHVERMLTEQRPGRAGSLREAARQAVGQEGCWRPGPRWGARGRTLTSGKGRSCSKAPGRGCHVGMAAQRCLVFQYFLTK